MKSIIKLSLITMSFAALAGCSTVDSTLGLGDSSDTASTSEDMKAPAVSKDSTDPTAKVSLEQNSSDQIVATIYTTYNNNPEGSVKLQWRAPKDTGCYNTSFPITKYGETNDKTHATVELKQGDKYCSGSWTANVVSGKDVIATDTISAS